MKNVKLENCILEIESTEEMDDFIIHITTSEWASKYKLIIKDGFSLSINYNPENKELYLSKAGKDFIPEIIQNIRKNMFNGNMLTDVLIHDKRKDKHRFVLWDFFSYKIIYQK